MTVKREKGKGKTPRSFYISVAPHVLMSAIFKLDEMEQFRFFTLSAIKEEKEHILERFDKHTKLMGKKEREQYYEYNSEDYSRVDEFFSKLSLSSFLIILYSLIEDTLNSLCDAVLNDYSRQAEIEGRKTFKIRYKDMNGEGIRASKLYLEKVFGVDLKPDGKNWAEIDALRKIRNAMVHDGGWANEDIAKNECVIGCLKKGFLEIEERRNGSLGKITIKPGYLDYILERTREFFQEINL
jgi:hypothetical protein